MAPELFLARPGRHAVHAPDASKARSLGYKPEFEYQPAGHIFGSVGSGLGALEGDILGSLVGTKVGSAVGGLVAEVIFAG